jgi:hypothetical protein
MASSTIVIAGALANKPRNGGEAWVRLSWIRSFQKLGFKVYFIEQIDPRVCVDIAGKATPVQASVNTDYFCHVTAQFGLSDQSALICEDGQAVSGLSLSELADVAAESALLINISGHLALPSLFLRFRRKAYIDIDPGFTQFWHAQGSAGPRLHGHDVYFTIGENIGQPTCPIPTGDIHWVPTRQPVVLEDWPVTSCADGRDRFTTIASWRGPYGPVTHDGQTYGLKVHEFRKLIELPRRIPARLEIALDIAPADDADRRKLSENDWQLVDPTSIAADPDAFRRYVQGSGGEFSVAQGIYVATGSGWFSDRTVRYLASGKPALVQDTAFRRNLPVGEGLVPFSSLGEAITGAETILSDYDRHARAAREIAEGFFESGRVVTRLLSDAGV